MPYKHTEKLIPKEYDKRVKLSVQDKLEIVDTYNLGGVSQRALAKHYNVSRRTIQFTLDPQKRKDNYAQRVVRGGSKQYYDKTKNAISMKTHRQHKQKLALQGVLDEK